jgi:hypothetical protein
LVQQVNQQEVGLSESNVHMFELIRYKKLFNLPFTNYKCQKQKREMLTKKPQAVGPIENGQILVLDLKLMPLVPAGRMQVQASNLLKQNIVQTFLI